MVAATGYYVGARLVGARPSGWLALNMVVLSAGTFFLIHYLTYRASEVNGVPVSQLVGFWEYLDELIRNTVIRRARGGNNGPGEPVGAWGYPLAALKVLGFACGGLAVWGILAARPYCRPCGRFLTKVGTRTRYHADAGQAATVAEQVAGAFDAADADRLQPALDAHAGIGEAKAGKCELRTAFEVWRCRGCGAGEVSFKLEKKSDNAWAEVPGTARKAETAAETELAVSDSPPR
jgi:hypothetical protein